MTDSESFYADLPPESDYLQVASIDRYHDAPDDWWIVVSDVADSTAAIGAGNYKQVNIAGALGIIGLINAAQGLEFPYVFGGDGSSALIPPRLAHVARRTLIAARARVREAFQLDLRVGFIPVRAVRARSAAVKVMKVRISPHFALASFAGGGLTLAERLIKGGADDAFKLADTEGEVVGADFSGLECRWQPLPSPKGETVALLVRTAPACEREAPAIYRHVIEQIDQLAGRRASRHPIAREHLVLARSAGELEPERGAKHGEESRILTWLRLRWMQLEAIVGSRCFRHRLKLGSFDAGVYQDALLENSDFQKFDDMIRMVIACSRSEREALEAWLEEMRAAGKIAYGLHVAREALLTCLVFDRRRSHVHFVDGANGGYALASRQLKRQLDQFEAVSLTGSKSD